MLYVRRFASECDFHVVQMRLGSRLAFNKYNEFGDIPAYAGQVNDIGPSYSTTSAKYLGASSFACWQATDEIDLS